MGADQRILVRYSDPSGDPPARLLVFAPDDRSSRDAPPNAVILQYSRHGWMATDAESRQTVPLGAAHPADVAGWHLTLLDHDPREVLSLDLEGSITDREDLVEPELRIEDAGSLRNGKPRVRSIKLPLVEGSQLVFGRAKECDIALSDAKASRRHMRVFVEGGRIYAEDLGSTWGSFDCDGRGFRGRRPFLHDDTLRIGDTRVTLVDPLSAFASPTRKAEKPRLPRSRNTSSRKLSVAPLWQRFIGATRVAHAKLTVARGALIRNLKRCPAPSRTAILLLRDGAAAFCVILALFWCVAAACEHLGMP